MNEITIFKGIDEQNVKSMLNCFNAKSIAYKKDTTIISNLANTNIIGIIIDGNANLIKNDYNGNRIILEKLEKGSIFGEVFTSYSDELSVIAISDCTVITFDYDHIIKRCKKSCPYHNEVINNMLQMLAHKVSNMNNRIDILTKKTIREKLLEYFKIQEKENLSKSFYLKFNYTELADYLGVDRSALMREIKNLKIEGFIETKLNRIKLLY
ncbi:MAG: Crp/Fnr family transcriptional regulator [Bacilli bacterium]|nr:Crp/Fnr family transcriptional regulator [Bacilli bacterium]MBP3635556.1 Crp/Fnr family transcriptional regulator [Bacilli bacterium]